MLNKVTIIVPVYNEFRYINSIIESLKKNINFEKQIIVVDDCSSDGTIKLIKNLNGIDKKIFHKKNMGKGAAIKSAIPFINGNIVAIQDADLEYDPCDLNILIQSLINENLNVIYGSRVLNKKRYSGNFISYFRIFGNQVLSLISNKLNNQKLTDAHTCYKVFKSDIFLRLNLQEDDFAFCPEANTKLSLLKIKIKELPISYQGRTVSDGKKIKFYDAVRALFTIIKYRFLIKF